MFLKQVSIDYNFDFIYDIDWEQYEHDCLGHQQVELKDIHEKVGGFPTTLCFIKNSLITVRLTILV